MLNDLLAFEKLAAGMFTVDRTPTALMPLLHNQVKMFQLSAQAKCVSLVIMGGAADLAVSVDLVKMKTVWRNLFSNAIKFSPVGGTIKVNVVAHATTETEQAHVVVSVKDSGAGMSGENLQQLFQEGVQFNANTLQGGGGSGFGLYISKGIVVLHDGKIWAESEGPGCGSTFFVKLPLADPISSAETLSRRNNQNSHNQLVRLAAAPAAPSVCLHILVVDDSDTTRKLVMRKLCSLGHTCVQAEDGTQAVGMVVGPDPSRSYSNAPAEALVLMENTMPHMGVSSITGVSRAQASRSIDLVLMDNNMPLMGGVDATFEMRRWGYMGVIMAVSGDLNEAEFLAAGADAFLTKPLSASSLQVVVDQFFKVGAEGLTEFTQAWRTQLVSCVPTSANGQQRSRLPSALNTARTRSSAYNNRAQGFGQSERLRPL